MGLHERPHTVVVELPETATVPDGYEAAPHSAGEVTLLVQITPKTPGYAMERFGIELDRPFKLMANTEDEPFLIYDGARVRWTVNDRERIFYIRGAVRLHAQGDDCDHCSVMLEEELILG